MKANQRLLIAIENHIDILFQEGKHEECLQSCHALLESEPNNATTHKMAGRCLLAISQPSNAKGFLLRAYDLQPDDPEIIKEIGNYYLIEGQRESAVRWYMKALAIDPNYAPAFSNLGVIKKQDGKIAEARRLFKRAIEIQPNFISGYINLGGILKSQGKLNQALAATLKAIELKPDNADAHLNLGSVLQDQDKLDQALAATLKAIELKPDNADAHMNLGGILKDQGKFDQALAATLKAIELKSDHADAHLNLGGILMDQGKLDQALAATLKAIELKSDHADAHLNLGWILREQYKLDDAIAATIKAIDLKPDHAGAHLNLGWILREQDKIDDAIVETQKAIDLKEGYEEAKYNLSCMLLKKEDFEYGWKKYEHRPTNSLKELYISKSLSIPEKNERVLVLAEEGIGDEIMFASCINQLYSHSGAMILQADQRLHEIYRRSFSPEIKYVGRDEQVSEELYDSRIHIGSLPGLFRNSIESFKQSAYGYLKADPIKTQMFSEELRKDGHEKIIGISWYSKAISNGSDNARRCISLEMLAQSIYSPKTRLVNLQYGDILSQVGSLKESKGIEIYADPDLDIFNDIDGLASLISACDEVISIDNVTAHLAGALGKRINILLDYPGDWRWGNSSKRKSYWYDSALLYRQKFHGDWNSPIQDVQASLSHQ